MATAEQTSVLIDPVLRRPVPIPQELRTQIASFEG
jgi:acyl-CoA thioesterase FadM